MTDTATPQPAHRDEHSEDKETLRRTAPPGRIVYRAILTEGLEELDRPSQALFWSGLAAGLSMGFSLITEGLLRAHIPDVMWRPLVVKAGYTIGFLIVILGRQQLFTENTLTPILPLMRKPEPGTFWNVARLWAVVLAANMLGALIVAWAAADTNIFEPNVKQAFVDLGHDAMRADIWTIASRAVMAGWLIALMVWLLPFAETARVWVILIITYVVGVGGFSHIIAGSVDVYALAWAGGDSWANVVGRFVLPTLVGNIAGGITLVAALNHAQVVAGGSSE